MYSEVISRAGIFEGTIKATDWDEGGNVLEMSLVDQDSREYPIYMDLKAESLTEYCKEKLRIKGTIQGGYLYINSFKFLRRR